MSELNVTIRSANAINVLVQSRQTLNVVQRRNAINSTVVNRTPVISTIKRSVINVAIEKTGASGLSAYQVWLAAGNSGTVQDFLDSLQGAPGSPGDQGDPGMGVADEAYQYLDLSDKIFGSIPAGGQGGEYIPGAASDLYYTRVGRTVTCVFLIAIPSNAAWPAANPFFPISIFGIKGSDLPYYPRIYPPNPLIGIPISAPGAFSLFNANSDDYTYAQGRAVGTVITDFGGSLDVPSMVFFKATDPNNINLDNLAYEGSPINLIGNNVVCYGRLIYEAAYAIGDEPV